MKKIVIIFIIMLVMSAAMPLRAEEDTSGTADRKAVIERSLRRARLENSGKQQGVKTPQEKKAGYVEQLKGKEIIIRHADANKSFFMGDKLHVVINGESITLEVTFPMQTSSRCRITAGDAGKIGLIHKGMAVYTGEKAPDVKEEEPVEVRVPAGRLRRVRN